MQSATHPNWKHDQTSQPVFSLVDFLSVVVAAACLAFGVTAIAYARLAVWLGQTNQLIIVGFVLAIMSMVTFKHAQTLLIATQIRFGPSTLQDYDAILQNDNLSFHSTITVRLTLLGLFVLPLVLSALYKRYVGGRTTLSISNSQLLTFAPAGLPGVYDASGKALFVNATASFFGASADVPSSEVPLHTSFGFNMHVINYTTTTMLDTPIQQDMAMLQQSINHGTTLTLRATVNATFARLNSTPDSPERLDDHYWARVADRIGSNQSDSYWPRGVGYGTWFDMWSGWIDSSLFYMAYYNDSAGERFLEKAYGFNIYRGTGRATWRISSDSVLLEEVGDLQTNYSPDTVHPEIQNFRLCDWDKATDVQQKIIYCAWSGLAASWFQLAPDYLMGPFFPGVGRTPAPLSNWVVVAAAMGWASTASKMSSGGWDNPQYAYLKHTPSYELSATYVTLQHHWGLYAILLIQPTLLLVIFIGRWLLKSTPMPAKFGLVSLLAGMQKNSLDVLVGSSYSGTVKEPVYVQVVMTANEHYAIQSGGSHGTGIEYVLFKKASTGYQELQPLDPIPR